MPDIRDMCRCAFFAKKRMVFARFLRQTICFHAAMNRLFKSSLLIGAFTKLDRAILTLLLAVLSIGIAFAPLGARGQATSEYIFGRFIPSAVFDDGKDAITLEVNTTGIEISEVSVNWFHEEGSTNVRQLYDDGTHGDRIAGDGIYTLDGLKKSPNPWPLSFGDSFERRNASVTITRTSG